MVYCYLQKVEYNPDPVNEKVIAQFSIGDIDISGLNLESLYKNLLQRRVHWVREVNMRLLERYQILEQTTKFPVVAEITFNPLIRQAKE